MKKIIATSFKTLGFNHNFNICMYLDPQDITRLQSTFKDAVKAIDVLRYEHFGLAPQEGKIKDWINQNVIWALSQMRKTRPDLYRMYVNRFGISQQRIENLIEQGNFGPLYKIISNNWAFAAICSDGKIRCWGNANDGGRLPDNLIPDGVTVNQIVSSSYAFAAICSDGQIRCWGSDVFGGRLPDNLIPDGVTVSSAEIIDKATPNFDIATTSSNTSPNFDIATTSSNTSPNFNIATTSSNTSSPKSCCTIS